jgi:hypothetical protein
MNHRELVEGEEAIRAVSIRFWNNVLSQPTVELRVAELTPLRDFLPAEYYEPYLEHEAALTGIRAILELKQLKDRINWGNF